MGSMRRVIGGVVSTGLLAAGLVAPAAEAQVPVPVVGCPAELPVGTKCYGGQDQNGAYYTIAVPAGWKGDLVMHAHGGPDLGAPTPERATDDLSRWAVMVREGYAWAGSSYRRGGYGTRMAVADTENLRQLFLREFGRPRRTFLHGQSWGGNVAAKLAEHSRSYDAVLLTNGVLAGGSRGYDYRVDLRVVYQYYCGNHPRPDEVRYPLWMGLRPGSTMTGAGLRARLQECTGIESAQADRSALQQRNLTDILAVTRIPERTLASHLNFASFTFRDIVSNRLGGRNPFSNAGVRYTGSHDDRALNAGVQRFRADPSARRDLSYDSDLTGAVRIPVLTMHAIDDPTAFVEHEAAYRATNRGALVQAFTAETEHSALSDAEYATVIGALSRWVSSGHRPTPASLAAACPAFDQRYGSGCFFRPDFTPAAYHSRVAPRPGGRHWPALTPVQEWIWGLQGNVGIDP